jgi:hypothetical protein
VIDAGRYIHGGDRGDFSRDSADRKDLGLPEAQAALDG